MAPHATPSARCMGFFEQTPLIFNCGGEDGRSMWSGSVGMYNLRRSDLHTDSSSKGISPRATGPTILLAWFACDLCPSIASRPFDEGNGTVEHFVSSETS
jgi:hypothetical protein